MRAVSLRLLCIVHTWQEFIRIAVANRGTTMSLKLSRQKAKARARIMHNFNTLL